MSENRTASTCTKNIEFANTCTTPTAMPMRIFVYSCMRASPYSTPALAGCWGLGAGSHALGLAAEKLGRGVGDHRRLDFLACEQALISPRLSGGVERTDANALPDLAARADLSHFGAVAAPAKLTP